VGLLLLSSLPIALCRTGMARSPPARLAWRVDVIPGTYRLIINFEPSILFRTNMEAYSTCEFPCELPWRVVAIPDCLHQLDITWQSQMHPAVSDLRPNSTVSTLP
jgi:hypothetical protein